MYDTKYYTTTKVEFQLLLGVVCLLIFIVLTNYRVSYSAQIL